MYLGVKEVKPIDNYKLILTFGNNEVKIFDMIPYLDKMIFQELKDKNLFKSVKVSVDSIKWPMKPILILKLYMKIVFHIQIRNDELR